MVLLKDLNQNILNSQNPYELISSDNGYIFETEHGQRYVLSFLLYPLVNENPNYLAYMFNIEPLNSKKAVKDVRIEMTIRHTFTKFFEENKDVLIVIMDTHDGRHKARKRLFELWYKNANVTYVEKINLSCKTEYVEIEASLFVEKSNPYNETIKTAFAELAELNFYC